MAVGAGADAGNSDGFAVSVQFPSQTFGAKGVHEVAHGLLAAATAGAGGITLLGLGRLGDHALVVMVQSSQGTLIRHLAAGGALADLLALFGASGLLDHGPVAGSMGSLGDGFLAQLSAAGLTGVDLGALLGTGALRGDGPVVGVPCHRNCVGFHLFTTVGADLVLAALGGAGGRGHGFPLPRGMLMAAAAEHHQQQCNQQNRKMQFFHIELSFSFCKDPFDYIYGAFQPGRATFRSL